MRVVRVAAVAEVRVATVCHLPRLVIGQVGGRREAKAAEPTQSTVVEGAIAGVDAQGRHARSVRAAVRDDGGGVLQHIAARGVGALDPRELKGENG